MQGHNKVTILATLCKDESFTLLEYSFYCVFATVYLGLVLWTRSCPFHSSPPNSSVLEVCREGVRQRAWCFVENLKYICFTSTFFYNLSAFCVFQNKHNTILFHWFQFFREVFFFPSIFFLRKSLTLLPQQGWDPLYRPGWSKIHRNPSASASPSTGVKDVRHHIWPSPCILHNVRFLSLGFVLCNSVLKMACSS